MNNFDGICIQLGLYRSADYICLSYPDFDKNDPKATAGEHDYPIFKELGVNRFRYIGVDCCPVSIEHMYATYAHEIANYYAEFLQAFIYQESGVIASFPYDLDYSKGFDPTTARWRKMTTLGFGDLLDYYTPCKIDLVVMDIEGSELGVLRNYDFPIRPRFMEVELHEVVWQTITIQDFMLIMAAKGYECVSRYVEDDRPDDKIVQALFRDTRSLDAV